MKLFALRREFDAALQRYNMATVIWGGDRFKAHPISQNADGSWLMEAQERTARTVPGTRITVQSSQIVAGTMPEAVTSHTAAIASKAATPPKPSRLADKAKLVAQGQQSLMTKVEAGLDAMMAAQANSASRLTDAMQKINAVQADIDAGTSALEDVANQLTNQG